jgi:L-asparaginase
MFMTKKVVFLGTGGTIAGRTVTPADNVGYQAAQIGVEQLVASSPALQSMLSAVEPVFEQVVQIDSKDMDWPHWKALYTRALDYLQQEEVKGLLITHGTDTLEETAFFLSQVLPVELLKTKPVVLTCAMRPANAGFPDGPQNLCDAISVVNSSDAQGVLVVCAGVVHTAAAVQKVHPYRLDAFDSGDAGPAGFVEEGRVRWMHPAVAPSRSWSSGFGQLPSADWPRVEIVMNAVGIGGAMVRALCAPATGKDIRVRGIVVAGTGNGTVNQDMEAALTEARRQGVRVVMASRCSSGQLVLARDAAAPDARYAGLSPVKARIALVLELIERVN